MFFKKGKKITVCLNQCDTSLTCVLLTFPQHTHSLGLSPCLRGSLSQTGLAISWKLLPTLLRFALTFLFSYIYLRAQDSPRALLLTDMAWNFTRQTESWFFSSVEFLFAAHAFPSLNFQQQFAVRAAAALSLFGFFFHSLFTYRTHFVLKGSQSPLAWGRWNVSHVGRVAVCWALNL